MAEKDRIRTKKVQVFLTESELQYARDKAKSCRLTMSEYIRQIIFKGLVVKLDTFDMKDMANELNHIGINLNQIARQVNANGVEEDMQIMKNVLKEFDEMQSFVYKKALGMDEGVEATLNELVSIFGREFLEDYIEKLD